MHTKFLRTRTFRADIPATVGHSAASRWLVGTAAVVLILAGGLLAVTARGGQRQPLAMAGPHPAGQIVGTAITDVNVHVVAMDTTWFDLGGTVVYVLPAGSMVRLTCEFVGTDASGAGDRWYRIAGPAVRAADVAVVAAAYVHVAGATVPACPGT